MASSSEYRRKLSTARAKEKLGFSIPDFSKMRFVLLGKNASENSQVGNLILGTVAFNSEAPPDEKIYHCTQRVGGILKKRHVTVVINSQLLQTNISDHQITQTVRECVFLSDPGHHAFILVLQQKDFTEEDLRRVKHVLKEFSEDAIKHTIVLTTDEETHRAKVNELIQQLTEECGGGHLQVKDKKKEKKKIRSQIFKRVENTLKIKYYHESMKETPKTGLSEDTEDSGSDDSDPSEDENIDESHKVKKEERSTFSLSKISNPFRRKRSPDGNRPNMSALNLVVCGRDGSLKSSVSDLILQQTDRRSDVELHDRLINLLELPALIGLSEEEVMRQTLRCVSLCDPAVHAFLLIGPVGPITNEDTAEIEKIQNIFDSREHFVVLFTSDLSVEALATDFVKSSTGSQRLISHFGGQHKVIGLKEPGNSRQIPELLDYIKNMKTEPYSLQMYVKAQENRVRHELEEQHKEELKRKDDEIEELQQKIQSEGTKEVMDDLKCLRIVLLGRTGSGKSATGNTILGREEFESESSTDSVTTVCMKGVGEVEGRSVAVVDTPGLFDTSLPNEQAVEEIVKCISLSSPGPHVFVIVLSLGRFTKEESDTVDLIKKIFGHKAAQFSIVLFTRGDDLGSKSIEDHVKKSNNAEFKKLLRDCGNRFMAFNNREKQDKTQVINLLNMIEELKSQHRYFTNSMFEEAEMSIKKRMEEIMKEREREIQTQKDELQAKYETEMKNMKERLEEEKQRAEEERIQRENEFRQKKENLIKEFEEKEKKQQKKQETENHKRSEEEKQKRAEYHQSIEEMKRENESQRSQYEKQKEEEDRKREEKYRQDQGKMKNEQERTIAELQMKQEEETKKRESEERKRIEQEEKQREEWKRKIKEAEHDRKETQEDVKRQQREWEDEKKRQTREREEEERKRKEKHEKELKEKQEEQENMRKSFEREKEEERQKIEKERQKQKREREEKEREYEEKKQETERHYEQLERKRKEDWERQKREDDERRAEERKRWERKIEDLKQEREEEIKSREKDEEKRKEREEKDRKEMKQKHDEEMKEMKKKYQDEARKQAEELNDFKERKEQHVQELQQMLEDHQKQQTLLEKLYQHLQTQKGEEIRELQKQVEEQKNKSGGCVIL